MSSPNDAEYVRLLHSVNEYVEEIQRDYVALPIEEQRRRGPCTLDHLLLSVMHHFSPEHAERGEGQADGAWSSTSLPFALRDVPALSNVAALQTRLTSTVLSCISTHPIITLFDLEEWVCAVEGVAAFVDLGIGVGLQVLPIVQQYFQLRPNSIVFPVRTQDVVSFLVNDPDAREVLLYGGGDARDLLNRFSHFYDRRVLAPPTQASSSQLSPPRGGCQRVQNVRQLGVHVQDYASFIAHLAQAIAAGEAAAREKASAALSARVYRYEQNRPLYERMVECFDASFAERELIANMHHTREVTALAACAAGTAPEGDTAPHTSRTLSQSSASPRGVRFAVRVADSEARAYALPMTMWSAASSVSDDKKGGVELRFHVGTESAAMKPLCEGGSGHAATQLRNEIEPQQLCSVMPGGGALDGRATTAELPCREDASPSTAIPTLQKPTSPPSLSNALPAAPTAARRRRGTVVSDVTSCVSAAATAVVPTSASAESAKPVCTATPAGPAAADVLASLLRPAGSLGVASGGTPAASCSATQRAPDTPVAATATKNMESSSRSAEDEAGAAARNLTPLEELCAFVGNHRSDETPVQATAPMTIFERLDRGVCVLERLSAGDVVSVKLLSLVWETMRNLCHTCSDASVFSAAQWRHRPFIPLFRASEAASGASVMRSPTSRLASLRHQLHHANGGGSVGDARTLPVNTATSSTAVDVREVLYMACPAEVCWTSWLPPTPATSWMSLLSCACLDRHYSSAAQYTLCTVLGVRRAPTVAAWYTAVRCVRRLCAPRAFTADSAQSYLEAFASCVDADVAARVADAAESPAATGSSTSLTEHEELSIDQERRKAEAALQALLDALRDVLTESPCRAGFFPCDYAWRCGLDGLLYASQRLCGYNGVLLRPSAAERDAPPLRVLCFPTTEPSWATCAVLQFLGVRPLDRLLETRVSFHATIHTFASGLLHDKIAAIMPYVQGFCRSRYPLWYAVAYPLLYERVHQLKVVLTAADAVAAAPRQLLRLHWEGHCYDYQRDIRLEYVAAHNILFGTAEAYAVPMLTEALLPLFTPLPMPTEKDRQQLRDVVCALISAVSSLQGSFEEDYDGAETQARVQSHMAEVVARAAAELHIEPFQQQQQQQQHSTTDVATVELPFTLPSRPFTRFQANFPPGTDALRQPRGPPTNPAGHHSAPSHASSHVTQRSASPLHKFTRVDAVALSRGRNGSRVGGARGAVQQRYDSSGRLSITLPLPGSGGASAAIISQPSWANFPMELTLSNVIATCDSLKQTGDHTTDVASDAESDSSEASASGEEDFVTFQYHRKRAGRALPTGASASASHKRARRDTVGRGGQAASLSANWWLRPPPASSTGGSGGGGDTPGYAVAAERHVYEVLCAEYAEQRQRQGVRVIWVNEHTEAGTPFDIVVIRPRGNAAAAAGAARQGDESRRVPATGNAAMAWDVVAYVEVKSTCTANRPDFELSLSELLFAARFGPAYKVYRVFGASTDKLRRMRCAVYADLVQLWYRAELTITSDIRVTPSK